MAAEKRVGLVSSTLAIGTATSFVLATAVVALLLDGQVTRPEAIAAKLHLRGTIAASDVPQIRE